MRNHVFGKYYPRLVGPVTYSDYTFTGNLSVDDIAVNGGDLTSTATTFNFVNATVTTLNIGGAATTVSIGASTGTTTINNDLTVTGTLTYTGDLTMDDLTLTGDLTVGNDGTGNIIAGTGNTTIALLNTVATTINAFGAATALNLGVSGGTTTIKSALNVDEAVTLDTTLGVTGNTTLTGDLAVNGGDITCSGATANIFNATPTTVNLGGAATTLNLGVAGGTTTIKSALNVDQAVTLDSTLGVTGVATFVNTGLHILDTDASHDLIIAPGSNLTVDRTLTVTTGDADRTLDISAGSVTISAFGATVIDDANAAAARTTLDVDQAGTDNSTDVTLAGTPDYITIAGQVITRGQIDLTADVTGLLPVGNQAYGTARQLLQTNAGATAAEWATNIDVPGTLDVTGATTLDSTLGVTGVTTCSAELAVDAAAGITTDQATFSLVDAVATTINFGGAATAVTIGAATGTCTIDNALTDLTGDLVVNGGNIGIDADTDLLTLTSGTLTVAGNVVATGATSTFGNQGSQNGQVRVMGTATGTGGELQIFNADDSDTDMDRWSLSCVGTTGDFRFRGWNNTSWDTVFDIDASTLITTFAANVTFPAATTSIPSINLPHGTAPSSPTNGDMWTTTAGLYVRINGSTVGPLS